MRTVLSVSLPEKMAQDLQKLAGEMGRNKSDVLRDALGNYLWEEKLRKARNVFYAKAKKEGIVTESDMLSKIS